MRTFHKREPRDLAAALRFYRGMEHEGAHMAEADVLAALLVLDGQADRYDDLPRSIEDQAYGTPSTAVPASLPHRKCGRE
jgi:hypothetical protein